jgi:membrane associated rhomboid family serine protease
MIPFKDDNPTTIFPFVTISLIAVNVVVFFFQMISPVDSKQIVLSYGAIPDYILHFKPVQPIHPFLTVFTSMFMHGGFLHIAGNMLYLWIFGNNIEDKLGHIRFLIFYLLCGIAAVYGHSLTEASSQMPMIGASGAVSGVLGAYLLLFPHARIHTLIFLGFFVQVVRIPALFVIGFWIVIQFINGLISKGSAIHGGVAWFAHIGGFVFGLVMIKLFLATKRRSF